LKELRTVFIVAYLNTLEPSDFEQLPPKIESLFISETQTPQHPELYGKNAWVAAMSHFEGFISFSIKGSFCDPDIMYGLQRGLKPLKYLSLGEISPKNPLTDNHLASLNLKLLNSLHIGGTFSCTPKAMSFLPKHALRISGSLERLYNEYKAPQ
jgi:hypothetical protein